MRGVILVLGLAACLPSWEREEFDVASDETGGSYQVRVWRPTERGPYDVLVVVEGKDGADVTGLSPITVGELQGYGEIEPTILVVVRAERREQSRLDFTPPTRVEDEGGGVDPFLRFLEDEILARVDDDHPTTGNRALMGTGFGGLCALWAALHGAGFQGYAALSPTLWWGESMIFSEEASIAETTTELPIRLLLAAGEAERWGATAEFLAFTERLESRGYEGLVLNVQLVPGDRAQYDLGLREAAVDFVLGEP